MGQIPRSTERILVIHNFIFGLGLHLKALASVSASRFWPRLTSLLKGSLRNQVMWTPYLVPTSYPPHQCNNFPPQTSWAQQLRLRPSAAAVFKTLLPLQIAPDGANRKQYGGRKCKSQAVNVLGLAAAEVCGSVNCPSAISQQFRKPSGQLINQSINQSKHVYKDSDNVISRVEAQTIIQ